MNLLATAEHAEAVRCSYRPFRHSATCRDGGRLTLHVDGEDLWYTRAVSWACTRQMATNENGFAMTMYILQNCLDLPRPKNLHISGAAPQVCCHCPSCNLQSFGLGHVRTVLQHRCRPAHRLSKLLDRMSQSEYNADGACPGEHHTDRCRTDTQEGRQSLTPMDRHKVSEQKCRTGTHRVVL